MHWRLRAAACLGLLVLAAAATPAEARHRHHHKRHHIHHRAIHKVHKIVPYSAPAGQNVPWTGPSIEDFSRPLRFIAGRLTCAVNVGAELARRGIRPTGSALAKSYLRWGRPSGPVPGAVAVYDRGGIYGHVAIVAKVENGRVLIWNPGPRGWTLMAYHKRPIAYRVPA